jgi:hypothetical protein
MLTSLLQIQQQLNILKKSTQECGVEIEKTRQMQEHHSINFYKHHQISGKEIEKTRQMQAHNSINAPPNIRWDRENKTDARAPLHQFSRNVHQILVK